MSYQLDTQPSVSDLKSLLSKGDRDYSTIGARNEESPKVIVHQSRLVVLRRARVHFLPTTVTVLLLVVHAKTYIQGPEFSQPFVLGLQVASKFHVNSFPGFHVSKGLGTC